MAFGAKCAIAAVTVFALLLTHDGFVDARRNQGSNQRKSSSSSNSGHVTQPSYNTNNNGGSNSHADVAKLSYPNYNSQPNRPANNPAGNPANSPPAAGWNVPQGPPPAYSASNPAGGSHTNMHEPPPAYHAPNYGAAPGANVHQPITATQNHGQQYAGAQPAGAYNPAGNYMPGGGYQPGGSYYPGQGGYHPAAAPPPGATYYQAGSALPPGATYYAQPPQQSSSGLGFGTGLIAGGLGGALLGHALTPSGGSSQPAAAAPAAAGGQDRIIIINNGVPVNASDGTTIINAAPVNGTQMAADAAPAQLAPFSPEGVNMTMANGTDASGAAAAAPAAPGNIICVPHKVNETDPADSSKMIEVEKIACYPAPPPPAAAPGAEPVPLAPMAPPMATSQAPPAMLAPDQAAVRSNTSAGNQLQAAWPLLAALLGGLLLRFVAAAGN
ncbi:uncharacterized protein [Drosophila virilis]|uniref:Uncharacterized protein n=1 Tax=Drosophila virilis TaxID=7244 RepID=B4MER4_DROVI|nr:nascent polypeptide-associated complex subunit alpha, muscle-specific form [Drosophila virilis]EDW63039.1 uncharacterized protein Dvir_GJ14865 [Drosophila virilis]